MIPPFASQGEAPASLTATHCVLRLMLSSPGRSFFFLFISSLANGSSPRVLFIPTSMHHFALGHIKLPFFLLFPSKFPMRMLNPCPSMGSLPFHPLTPLPYLSPSNSPTTDQGVPVVPPLMVGPSKIHLSRRVPRDGVRSLPKQRCMIFIASAQGLLPCHRRK